MRAYHLLQDGAGSRLVLRERETPEPGPTEILIQVHAASINRRDLMIQRRSYPLPAREGVVPLSDSAGEVVAAGPCVTRFKVGDRVTGSYFPRWHSGRLGPGMIDQLGCTINGMAADHALLDEQWAARLPDHLSWAEGACLSCAGVTAWCAVTGSAFSGPGRTVLTLGTGDTSLFAVRFAGMMGCRVIATTSSEAKAERLRALGADAVVNYAATPGWGPVVRELTGGEGADLIVETMGPATIEQSLIAAARHSEIAVLIWRSAERQELVLPAAAYGPKLTNLKRLFVGPRVELEAMIKAMALHRIGPVVDRVFAFDELDAAYRHFESRSGFGKVVLRVGQA